MGVFAVSLRGRLPKRIAGACSGGSAASGEGCSIPKQDFSEGAGHACRLSFSCPMSGLRRSACCPVFAGGGVAIAYSEPILPIRRRPAVFHNGRSSRFGLRRSGHVATVGGFLRAGRMSGTASCGGADVACRSFSRGGRALLLGRCRVAVAAGVVPGVRFAGGAGVVSGGGRAFRAGDKISSPCDPLVWYEYPFRAIS